MANLFEKDRGSCNILLRVNTALELSRFPLLKPTLARRMKRIRVDEVNSLVIYSNSLETNIRLLFIYVSINDK